MKVTALGTGDAFSADRYSSCLLVEDGTTRLLVDCPHPIRKILKESTRGRVDVGDIDGLLLTHLHADHASGVEGFAWFCRFALQKKARVHAHPAVLEHLWAQLQGSMGELLHVDSDNKPHHRTRLDAGDVLEMVPFLGSLASGHATAHAGGQPGGHAGGHATIGTFMVESRLTIHHIPTTALRFTSGVAGEQRSFGYSADTAYDPELIAWLMRSDLVVHETNWGAHTPYARLAALPLEQRQKMRLIHWPDEFDGGFGGGGAIARLHDGDVIDV